MNSNSNIHSVKTKCSCLDKLIFDCLKKKQKRKKSSDQNSELDYILTKKKDLLQINNQNNNHMDSLLKETTNPKISTTRLDIISKKRNKSSNFQSGNGIGTIKKEPEKLRKKFFHEFKDKLRCFFCGGKNCKHENYLNNKSNNNAIEGLNSNYITENIIASQRPSEVLIEKYKLVSKFKELNIGLIVNLQREGEHPYCGPNAYNLTSAGYSYNPSVFTGDDIKCKLSGWKDMEVPSSMNYMLDIVKEISIIIDNKAKCLVHCHAGYGRTGVVIVCYLLFSSLKDCDTVIKEVRSKRKKCVETKQQIKYCKKFEDFLNHSRLIFGNKESIDVYLKRQEDLLYGEELKKYGFVPKLIAKVLDRICFLKKKHNLDNIMIYKLFQGLLIDWNDELENILVAMKNMINKSNWVLFEETENLMIIIELLFDWFEDCVEYVISPERTEIIISNNIYTFYSQQVDDFFSFKNMDNNKVKEFFDFIKKEYHCFEYEVLFYFANFLMNFPPKGLDEEGNFDKMIERLSLELLGFSFSEKTTNEKYNELILPLINGLSKIIKSIYYSLKISENEYLNESTCFVCPKRKNIPIEFTISNEINNTVPLRPIPRKRISMFVKSDSHFLKNSNVSDSSPIFIQRQKTGNNALQLKNHYSINNEAKLKKIYNVLNRHFSSKKNVFIDDIKSNLNYTNEGISGFSIDSLTPEKTITRKSKQIEEVIEEILNKGSNSCSSSSIDANSTNSKKSLKKNIFKSPLSPIHTMNKNEIPTNNYIGQEDKKPSLLDMNNNNNNNNKKNDNITNNIRNVKKNFSRSKSILFEKKEIPSKNSLHRKSIVDELKCFNSRNSDLGNKVRKKGLDMTKCKGKSDRALIDLMKYMNSVQKNLNEKMGKMK